MTLATFDNDPPSDGLPDWVVAWHGTPATKQTPRENLSYEEYEQELAAICAELLEWRRTNRQTNRAN